jgi:lipooligosaccharide transport system permease protein
MSRTAATTRPGGSTHPVRTTPPIVRVVEREFQVYRRLWRGLAASMFLNPLLFLAAMGLGLGGLVDENAGHVAGVTYLQFVAPGLMVASAVQLAAGESLWPVMAGVKWIRFYHGIVATPIRASDVFGGFVVWNAIRTMMGSTVFLMVAALLGAVVSWWGLLAIPVAALTAAAFCAPLGAFSVTQETDFAFPVIMRLGILPLFLFSGTFFPVSELPNWLEPLAALSPLWHGVVLARGATTGEIGSLAVVAHVAALLVFVGVGSRFGVRDFTRRLTA